MGDRRVPDTIRPSLFAAPREGHGQEKDDAGGGTGGRNWKMVCTHAP